MRCPSTRFQELCVLSQLFQFIWLRQVPTASVGELLQHSEQLSSVLQFIGKVKVCLSLMPTVYSRKPKEHSQGATSTALAYLKLLLHIKVGLSTHLGNIPLCSNFQKFAFLLGSVPPPTSLDRRSYSKEIYLQSNGPFWFFSWFLFLRHKWSLKIKKCILLVTECDVQCELSVNKFLWTSSETSNFLGSAHS